MSVRIAALGIGPFGSDSQALLHEAEDGIRILAREGARLVVLPELFAAPFFAADAPERWAHMAETLDGPTCRWAAALARETGVALVFGMAVKIEDGPPANAAVLAEPGRTPHLAQRKVHLAPAAGHPFAEADHFSAGPPSIGTFEVAGLRCAALVCYDRRFPECWRAAARAGADIVLVLVGGPTADPPGLYEAEIRTHARANALYALCAARHGRETVTGTALTHDGATIAATPDGELVRVHGARLLLDIDPGRLAAARAANPTYHKLRLKDPALARAIA